MSMRTGKKMTYRQFEENYLKGLPCEAANKTKQNPYENGKRVARTLVAEAKAKAS